MDHRDRARQGGARLQPDLGVNAIASMARLVLRLAEVLPDREHPLVGRPSVNAAVIAGGSAQRRPDRCELVIDRRIVPGETDPAEVLAPFDRLAAAIRSEHPEVDLTFRSTAWTDAAEAERDPVIAGQPAGDRRRARRGPAPTVGFTGITDARFYINDAHIPTIIMGPDRSRWRTPRTSGCWSTTWSRPPGSMPGSSWGSSARGRGSWWSASTSS